MVAGNGLLASQCEDLIAQHIHGFNPVVWLCKQVYEEQTCMQAVHTALLATHPVLTLCEVYHA